jgi:hypothetical protein
MERVDVVVAGGGLEDREGAFKRRHGASAGAIVAVRRLAFRSSDARFRTPRSGLDPRFDAGPRTAGL